MQFGLMCLSAVQSAINRVEFGVEAALSLYHSELSLSFTGFPILGDFFGLC